MPQGEEHFELSPEDQRVLDELAESGFDPAKLDQMPPEYRPRAERLADLLGLLHDYPVEDGDDTLIHATLARIDRFENDRVARMTFDATEGKAAKVGSRRRIRLPDFISVAAVLLIAAAVLWPMVSDLRKQAIDRQCANNLRRVGYGFSQYAADHGGAMPVARAGLGQSWDAFSNVVNLAPLTAGEYCELGHLRCPGGHDNAPSGYSYQFQAPGASHAWDAGPDLVVLGDRNPLIDAFRAGRFAPALSISLNHGGRGQNVLVSDGSIIWLVQPVIGKGDNIWLPSGQDALHRGATPAGWNDVFLAH